MSRSFLVSDESRFIISFLLVVPLADRRDCPYLLPAILTALPYALYLNS